MIELDGGQHLDMTTYDTERTRRIGINGYRVLRYWNDDVLLRIDLVLEDLLRNLERGK